MDWLTKMEQRWGRKAPRNLMLVIAGGQIAVWLVVMLAYQNLYSLIQLTRSGLAAGQVWRLVSVVFSPVSMTVNPLLFALALYLIYMIGTSLERAWGSFKFDMYLVLGMAGAWVACLITGYSDAMALYYSLFLAFAYLFPEVQLLLFFFIPVKVKWLGWIAAAMCLLNIVAPLFYGDWRSSVALLVGLANFLLFFGKGTVQALRAEANNRRRRREWQNQWRDR